VCLDALGPNDRQECAHEGIDCGAPMLFESSSDSRAVSIRYGVRKPLGSTLDGVVKIGRAAHLIDFHEDRFSRPQSTRSAACSAGAYVEQHLAAAFHMGHGVLDGR
jgi:hypothetical protein